MEKLPTLLLIAWLLPLASFTIICIGYSIPQMLGMRVRYSTQKYAGYIAIAAIVGACALSMTAMFGYWLPNHPLPAPQEHFTEPDPIAGNHETATEASHGASHTPDNGPKTALSGNWYSLGE